MIFVDDLGYADIGPFGATKQKTPHLDRMANEGMKLTNFYAAPVCSVSRAQLLTGCYGARVSVPGVFFPADPQGLNPNEVTVADFGDWVEEVDWSVGQVLDQLRELKLSEKTLVVFTSDNGPWLIKGADGGSAKPLRAGKGTTWEGGVRVPTIAWWPGAIAPRTSVETVAGTIDLLPTFVTLAGGTVPAAPVIDGRDLSAVLLGKSKESPRDAHYYFSGYNLQAIRQGSWKLALVPQPDATGGKAAAETGTNPRLYNLDSDIGETTNVADKNPAVVEKLKKLADAMIAEIGGQKPKSRRPAGTVANPVTLYPTVEEAKDTPGKPAALDKLKPGDVVKSDSAPRIGGQAFSLTYRVETELRETIILAHGGSALGYALHMKDGRVVFSVRTSMDRVTDVQSEPIQGAVAIKASVAKDGTLALTVGDQKAVTAKAPGPIPRQPQEDFCVGLDNGQPVAMYSKGKPFAGKLTDLSVTVLSR